MSAPERLSADDVAPCQFSYGVHDCESDDARRYKAADGGEVWLCIQHRGWLASLGLRLAHNDGHES